MAELRGYQEDLRRRVERVLDADAGARVMMQLPTGGGKTVIAGELLKRRLTDGRKAVWLTHRRELADQTRKMLDYDGVTVMPVDRDWHPGTDAPTIRGGVVILMAQTVGRRTGRMEVWNRYDTRDLMIIDEAHHATAPGWERAMKQWPGQVVGMTATPWRLSEKEGFDHLFQGLIPGPQVADLQSDDWLCDARVLVPSEDGRVLGGAVDRTGDFSESGIESANSERVMTAGVLRFWQEHAHDRQTIVYAVSVDHADNLARVFENEGIPAAVLLGDTGSDERTRAIAGFKDGSLKVLINVLVATEGFDLPDASCVVITRPTLSLALFMQMIGRGLRPKDGGGDCLVLDLAANTLTHGLPEQRREWSLAPRGNQPSNGEAPVVRCEKCAGVSAAASHNCAYCGEPFGKECGRCGKWRAWQRWQFENHCGDAHETVCDHCHIDAHEQAHLPVTPPLDELADLADEEEDMEMNSELADRLASVLRELLEQERQRAMGPEEARQRELTQRIQTREGLLSDSHGLYDEFVRYVDHLPYVNRPQNDPQRFRMYERWVTDLKTELGNWRDQLGKIKDSPVDKELIFANAQNEVTRLLKREAKDAGLLPNDNAELPQVNVGLVPDRLTDWISLSSLQNRDVTGTKPERLLTPDGKVIQIKRSSLAQLSVEVAEWLINSGRPLNLDTVDGDLNSDRTVYHRRGLSNGLWLNVNRNANELVKLAIRLIEKTGPHVEFKVKLRE